MKTKFGDVGIIATCIAGIATFGCSSGLPTGASNDGGLPTGASNDGGSSNAGAEGVADGRASNEAGGSTSEGGADGSVDGAAQSDDSGQSREGGDATIAGDGGASSSSGDGSPGPAVSVVTGFGVSCSVTEFGDIECWNGNTSPSIVPTLTGDAVSVSIGGGGIGSNILFGFSCAVTTVGGAWCWGSDNRYGWLGNGTTTGSSVPTPVQSLGSGVVSVSAGLNLSACAVKTDGSVWCWGLNDVGQLGNASSAAQSAVPVQLSGFSASVTAVSVGIDSSCVLDMNGAVWCWGNNNVGQLGNNSTTNSLAPVQVMGLSSGVTAVSVGNEYACAVVGGAVECWGNNGYGQSLVPATMMGLTSGATAVSVGYFAACAIVNGGVQCWGDNSSGELGNNSTTDSAIPVPVSTLGSGVVDISIQLYDGDGSASTGGYSTSACAIGSGNAVWCWGDDTAGSVPVRVDGL